LASLEIETCDINPHRLDHHYQSISGQSFETLAVKLIMGRTLQLSFPHVLPMATLGMLDAHKKSPC
jgi:hypothetical protein